MHRGAGCLLREKTVPGTDRIGSRAPLAVRVSVAIRLGQRHRLSVRAHVPRGRIEVPEQDARASTFMPRGLRAAERGKAYN